MAVTSWSTASAPSLHGGLLRVRLYLRGDRLAHEKEPAVWTGEGSFDEQDVVGRVDADQRVVARRDAIDTHVAGHADALLGLTALTTPRGARGERTGRPVLALGAVRGGLTTE